MVNSIKSINVRQLVILSPLSLPALKKRGKENELAKPVLNKIFSDPFDFHKKHIFPKEIFQNRFFA